MRNGFIMLALVLIFGIMPAFAQTEDDPLLPMLARIPDSGAAREFLSYIDYRALIAARPGAPTITSWDEFDSYIQRDNQERDLLISALSGIQSGPQSFAQNLMESGEMAQVVGFDPFTIERAVEYGSPPASVVILEGDFDPNIIIAAHENRSYTVTEVNGLALLCGEDGCDSGIKNNFRSINRANPFGGELGRSQPVLVGDGLVASSTSIETLNAVASTISGAEASLADQPNYRAAAEAISAKGTLLQCYFVRPTDIAPVSSAITNPNLTPAEVTALLDTLRSDFIPLPPYNLVVLADTATETQQQALVALVYTNQADAEAVAALFPDRLENYESLRVGQPFGDMLADRGVTSVEATVYAASTDRYVTVLTLHAPLPADSSDSGRPESSSQVYALLVRAYFTRDLGWLATEF